MNNEKIEFNLDVEKDGPLNKEHVAQFSQCRHFDEVYFRSKDGFAVKDAKIVEHIKSVFEVTIWCNVARAAVSSLTSRPNLKKLILFGLKRSGRIAGFEQAQHLEFFQCMYGLNDNDLLEVATAPNLQELGAQQAKITKESLAALLDKPLLRSIDFECSNFNDDFAEMISKSKTITKLEIGATRLTKTGLAKLCSMKQLKELDIWSNRIGENEIDMLAELPNLEFLSIGGSDEQKTFTAKNTLPKLHRIPALKRVWLDGLRVTTAEWEDLNQRYERVQVTAVLDDC